MRTKRENRSVLAVGEQRVIGIILPYIPSRVSSDHLTYFGFIGAVLTGVALALCRFSAAFETLAMLGLALNWFGDSFDGSLARYRGIERPRYGFLIDHSIDLVSTAFILVGLGISPYLPFDSACFALITYLLFCGFVYIKVAADGVHKLDFCGLGATEFRLLVAAWVLVVHGFNFEGIVNRTVDGFQQVAVLDLIVGVLCCIACLGLICIIFREASRPREIEPLAFEPSKVVELLKSERPLTAVRPGRAH
jgi:phosphatidylglycerophosphate synthase